MLRRQRAQVSQGLSPDVLKRRSQHQVRLSAEDQATLVDRYRAGAIKKELARVYGINVETVLAIIMRHGADRENVVIGHR
jgi:hypothetical protein